MTDIIKPRYAMDKHDIDAFVRSRMYMSNIVICDELGIHESTFYRLLRDNPHLPMLHSLAVRVNCKGTKQNTPKGRTHEKNTF